MYLLCLPCLPPSWHVQNGMASHPRRGNVASSIVYPRRGRTICSRTGIWYIRACRRVYDEGAPRLTGPLAPAFYNRLNFPLRPTEHLLVPVRVGRSVRTDSYFAFFCLLTWGFCGMVLEGLFLVALNRANAVVAGRDTQKTVS